MTQLTAVGRASIDGVLAGDVTDLAPFHGFGGLQGGLTAGLLLREARRAGNPSLVPIETTVHFLRPLVAVPDLAADVQLSGRSTSVVTSTATQDGNVRATATSVLGVPRTSDTPTTAPRFPEDVTPPDRSAPFVIPPDFVPFSSRIELRLTTEARPFSGHDQPALSGWIRVTEPVRDPFERLLLLADTLPPSYAATLTEMRQIPSVRITARFTPAVATTPFDWVLVHAETNTAGSDGWLSEDITIWAEDGTLLATSTQLRVVR